MGEPEAVPYGHEGLLLVEHPAKSLGGGGRDREGRLAELDLRGIRNEGLGRSRLPDRMTEERQTAADRDVPGYKESGPVLDPGVGQRCAPEGVSLGLVSPLLQDMDRQEFLSQEEGGPFLKEANELSLRVLEGAVFGRRRPVAPRPALRLVLGVPW